MTNLRVENLRKSFGGVHAVADVSFHVADGEIVALIGPNGAGKSTCFNLLNGQLPPDRGRIYMDGTDITGLAVEQAFRRGIGRCFQVAATFASMSVRENVQMALLSRAGEIWNFTAGANGRHVVAADALLEQVGMAAFGNRPCGTLSHGDLKRLELAIALAGAPALLLMDEPTAGMAPAERGAMMALVRGVVAERGISVLFTEHDMDAVFGSADRILVMDRGTLIADGSPAQIRADRRVRAVYLGQDSGEPG